MELKEFQLNAVKSLFEAMESSTREVILKSPTGSGKTIILTYFMNQYMQSHPKTACVWLTVGTGELEEQSKAKMDKYIHGSQTKLLSDIMTVGFEENDACFINWEKLTKKGNNALKPSERTNFKEHIENAHNNGLNFIVIVDESHLNDTIKSDIIIGMFNPQKIIKCSATPKKQRDNIIIEIPEEEVIIAGLIKKSIAINYDFPQIVEIEDDAPYLLEKALAKQEEIRSAFLKHNININPLIVVQLPNKWKTLQDNVEHYLEEKDITYANGKLAIWLSDKHRNIDDIALPNAKSCVVIIKQAVATGWDCPRAQILVKLREGSGDAFEIQTIGRIRRMPEAKHYGDDLLDTCYIYTLDKKFTQGMKTTLGDEALNVCNLQLKSEYKNIKLVSEQRSGELVCSHNPQAVLRAISTYARRELGVSSNASENKGRLEVKWGYNMNNNIVKPIVSGESSTIEGLNASNLNTIDAVKKLNTRKLEREYTQVVTKMAFENHMTYSRLNAVIRSLFDSKYEYSQKILDLEPRDVYVFVLNNIDRIRDLIRNSLAYETSQLELTMPKFDGEFHIPETCRFTYNNNPKIQKIMRKNVYENYLSSAAPRSTPEIKFEKFCEDCDCVEWWYKNGNKGENYLSIMYQDNGGKEKLFYPDYILSINGDIWIIETKGGFDRKDESHDIDLYTSKKFKVLKKYLNRHNFKGGIVRNYAADDELYICTENYNDDIMSESWKLLKDFIA